MVLVFVDILCCIFYSTRYHANNKENKEKIQYISHLEHCIMAISTTSIRIRILISSFDSKYPDGTLDDNDKNDKFLEIPINLNLLL